MPSLAEILHRKQEEQKEREAAETARLAAEAAAEAKAEAKRAEQAKQMWAPYRAKARETRSLLDSSGLPQLMEEAKAIVEPYARREPWIAVEPLF